MYNTLTLNVLLPPWITKPQSSTGLNWGSETMLFIRVYFYLTDASEHFRCGLFLFRHTAYDVPAFIHAAQKASCADGTRLSPFRTAAFWGLLLRLCRRIPLAQSAVAFVWSKITAAATRPLLCGSWAPFPQLTQTKGGGISVVFCSSAQSHGSNL